MKKIALLPVMLLSINANADVVHLNAVSNTPQSCQAGHVCQMPGIHDIEIINQTPNPHLYRYFYQVCVNVDGYNTCVNAKNEITVNPWQKWNNHHDSLLEKRLPEATHYDYYVMTQVMGETSSTMQNNYRVQAR